MDQNSGRTKEWLRGPLDRYRDYVEQSFRLMSLAISGISRMINDPQLIEAIVNYEMTISDAKGSPLDNLAGAHVTDLRGLMLVRKRCCAGTPNEQTEDQQGRIVEARTRGEFATQEVEQGFPLLCGHAIVGLWGAFEAAMEDFLVRWILYNPGSLEAVSQLRLRVPARNYMNSTDQERAQLLLTELSRNLQADVKLGVSRFEELLSRFDLGGNSEQELRQKIFEMQQVRHIWAHRGGLADVQFKERCPWFDVEVEELVKVDMDKVEAYGSATIYYIIDIWLYATKRGERLRSLAVW